MSASNKNAPASPSGKRLALVIGVNKTCSSLLPFLSHAITDAQAMAEVLRDNCGFELLVSPLLGEQATSEVIRKAVRTLVRERTDADFLLFYFSGHGQPMTVEADGHAVYLGSSDFDEKDIKYEDGDGVEYEEDAHLSFRWLRDKLFEGTRAGRVLLILDCCFAGEMGRTAPDHYLEELQRRLTYYFQGPGAESRARSGGLRLALTATGHNSTAREDNTQGVMTGRLLPALRGKVPDVVEVEQQGAISLQLLHRYLERFMPAEQQPSVSGDYAGRSCILAHYPELVKHMGQVTAINLLSQQMKAWFKTLNYGFEDYEVQADNYFEWIINVPTRRRYERILVRAIEGEAKVSDVNALHEAVDKNKTDEGWLVAIRRVGQAARDAVKKPDNDGLYCYTFDELLDDQANFEGYLNWLEAEIKRQGIDTMYVPLSCSKDDFDPITKQKIGEGLYNESNGWIDGYIDRWLDDPSKEHISILGEFGTGKTWFALHYAWKTLVLYRDAKARGTERPRLPLIIPLRDYAKAVSIESLFSEFFFRKHEIRLPGYSAFEQLNRMGKLLLIFDGFDEMADKIDRQKMINNFWELAKLVVPGAKAILTCRTEHFPDAKESRALLNAELQSSTANLTGESPQFEVLELKHFNNTQIRQVLSLRADPATVEQVMSNRQLMDLARRPLMTELILQALPEIELGKPIDISRVYLYAVRHKMEQNIKEDRTFTSLADKLYFLGELSWEMLSKHQMSLNYRLFPDRLRRLFGSRVQEQKDLDYWHFDMMSQTMLIRNADGDYTPAHRSLLEFFVAYKFAAELGVLASDFTELAKEQSHLNIAVSAQEYAWSSYFQRTVDDKGAVKLISPLREFVSERLSELKATVGKEPITKAILELIQNMLLPDEKEVKSRLLAVIVGTREEPSEEVGFIGSNIVQLLIFSDFSALLGQDLSLTNLDYANFTNADLTDCNLQGAQLRQAQFHGSTMKNANLCNADLTGATFNEMDEVRSVAFNDTGNLLAAATDSNLKIWELPSERVVLDTNAPHKSYLRDVLFSPTGDTLVAASKEGVISVRKTENFDLLCVFTDLGRDEVHRITYRADGVKIATGSNSHSITFIDLPSQTVRQTLQTHESYVTSMAFTHDGTSLLTGDNYGIIRDWSVEGNEKSSVIDDLKASVNNITFSPDGGSFAVATLSGINIYSTETRKIIYQLSRENNAWSIAYSSDGNIIASVNYHQIVFWSAKTYLRLLTLHNAHENVIRRVVFSSDNSLLASGSLDATIKLWDARPFITRNEKISITLIGYTSPDLTALSDDPATWPQWYHESKIDVPEGMLPNPDFGKCLRTIKQKLNCQGLQLRGAKGLDVVVDPNRHKETLGQWLNARGAILK